MKIKLLLCMALAITLFSCGKDDEPGINDANGQSNNSSVVINADGSTSTGVPFSMLDGTTFYLDYIKYEIVDSHLEIVGSDPNELAGDICPYAHVTLNGTTYNTRMIRLSAFGDGYGHYDNNMQSLSIPSTVQTAYIRNNKLSKISIPNSVTNLIISCPKITELTIPNSVKFLALDKCSSLTEISIPNSVTSIGGSMFGFGFYGCSKLTEIIIPNSVTRIWDNTFSGCENLRTLVLPENLDNFCKDCITGCDSLSDIYLGKCDYVSGSWPSHKTTITIHVKSEYINEMTNKLLDDKITVVGDYSSSILN